MATAADKGGDIVIFDYLIENWRRVLELTLDHLRLSLTAVALALIVAIPLGIVATRFRRLTLP
ncbi:MAG: hypothetical protein M3411_07245, partial [Chloroflexota bacterium]|nr:hypothetical protein [Chloroflexota bacterium]